MVILVDGPAHRAKGIVAVGQHIGNREFLQARCSGCLDNSHECDVVGGQFIEFDLKAFHISGGVVVLQYVVCHGLRCCFFLGHGPSGLLLHCGRIFHDLGAVHKINAFVVELYHLSKFLLFLILLRQFILARFCGKVNLNGRIYIPVYHQKAHQHSYSFLSRCGSGSSYSFLLSSFCYPNSNLLISVYVSGKSFDRIPVDDT